MEQTNETKTEIETHYALNLEEPVHTGENLVRIREFKFEARGREAYISMGEEMESSIRVGTPSLWRDVALLGLNVGTAFDREAPDAAEINTRLYDLIEAYGERFGIDDHIVWQGATTFLESYWHRGEEFYQFRKKQAHERCGDDACLAHHPERRLLALQAFDRDFPGPHKIDVVPTTTSLVNPENAARISARQLPLAEGSMTRLSELAATYETTVQKNAQLNARRGYNAFEGRGALWAALNAVARMENLRLAQPDKFGENLYQHLPLILSGSLIEAGSDLFETTLDSLSGVALSLWAHGDEARKAYIRSQPEEETISALLRRLMESLKAPVAAPSADRDDDSPA